MSLILDPVEVAAPGREELDLMSGSVYVKAEGIDWGDTALSLQKGTARWGEPVLGWSMPNRIVKVPLVLKTDVTGATLIQAIQSLQAKVARINEEGGTLKRVRRSEDLYADVVAAEVVIPDTWLGAHREYETETVLTLECLPDFYGDEIVHTLNPLTDNYSSTIIDHVQGNYPGRCRIVAKATTADMTAFRYAFRSKHYQPGSGNALNLKWDQLTPLGSATTPDPLVLQDPGRDWVPVCSTDDVTSGDPLEHVGTYRVFVEYSLEMVNLLPDEAGDWAGQLRLAWAQGDLIRYEENVPTSALAASIGSVYKRLADLGAVRLPDDERGASRWRGVVQHRDLGERPTKLSVHRVILVPVDEPGGAVIGQPEGQLDLAGPAINDKFRQSAGNLTGKPMSPASAGVYTTLLSGGSDFVVNATEQYLTRSGNTSSGEERAAGSAGPFTDFEASVRIRYDGYGAFNALTLENVGGGLIVRAKNANDYFFVGVSANGPFSPGLSQENVIVFARVKNGSPTSFPIPFSTPGAKDLLSSRREEGYTLSVRVVRGYVHILWEGAMIWQFYRDFLAPGGDLDSGGIYIYDRYVGSLAGERRYDDFRVTPISADPIALLNRDVEIGTSGCYRQSADGLSWGEITARGDLPRIPVSGRERRPVQVQLMRSSGDFGEYADIVPGGATAELRYRPCWISVPE